MNNFSLVKTYIENLVIVEGRRYSDERGYFEEVFRQDSFQKLGLPLGVSQCNVSCSAKGVVRGLHYQKTHGQGKLVGVLKGAIYDVAVDLREGSQTFGEWKGLLLTEKNQRHLYVPEGFAHGFLSLAEDTLVLYHCTDIHYPAEEAGIYWQDPTLAIDWPIAGEDQILLSEKDRSLPSFQSLIDEGWSYS